jgi:hypothetical protein
VSPEGFAARATPFPAFEERESDTSRGEFAKQN